MIHIGAIEKRGPKRRKATWANTQPFFVQVVSKTARHVAYTCREEKVMKKTITLRLHAAGSTTR